MRALLVIDVQQGFTEKRNFQELKDTIERLIHDFKKKNEPVIFIRHLDETEGSPIEAGTPGAEIDRQLAPYVTVCVEKKLPSAFHGTRLNSLLREKGVDEVVLTGFNSEYCIFFNSAAAFEHGYRVTVVEEGCSSVNSGDNYDMHDLDIPEFIFAVLDNSGEVNLVGIDDLLPE